MTPELRADTWRCLEPYTIGRSMSGDGERFVRAKRPVSRERRSDGEYRPLVSYPHLFLKFARVADDDGLDDKLDTDKNAAAALSWANGYGVLGLTQTEDPSAWRHDPYGGPGDSVKAFAREAWLANKTLKLYEAATRSGGVDVDAIASIAREKEPQRYHGLIASSPGMARDYALHRATANIQHRVARYAHPQLYQRATGTFVEGYGFSNLLGALWLQALWLLTADDVRRCAYAGCNRVLDYKQPEKPLDHKKGERKEPKTYKNKRFCDNTCVVRNRRKNRRRARAA